MPASIVFGFTGYLLPWNQKAYWATTVGTAIAGPVPWLGEFILKALRGGPDLEFQHVARVIDIARGAGLSRIALISAAGL